MRETVGRLMSWKRAISASDFRPERTLSALANPTLGAPIML
jgi:hypothetical protein